MGSRVYMVEAMSPRPGGIRAGFDGVRCVPPRYRMEWLKGIGMVLTGRSHSSVKRATAEVCWRAGKFVRTWGSGDCRVEPRDRLTCGFLQSVPVYLLQRELAHGE